MAVLLSEKEIHSTLGDGLAIEYTRDSPLFRQQISAFEDSFQSLPDYCKNVLVCLQDVDKSFMNLKESHTKLATALTGREKGYSRSLFTNAFPSLGDLSETLRMVADALLSINNVHEQIRETLKNDVAPLFEELSMEDLSSERALLKRMEAGYEDYEAKLGSALQSRTRLPPEQVDDIARTRRDYELSRFDLVSRLNQADARKKVLLTQAACNIHITYNQAQDAVRENLHSSGETIEVLGAATVESADMLGKKQDLWNFVRAKLQGELMGAMPPPGAPPGALSPVQPRWHPGMPVYTATICTEVLSSGSRSATFEDMRHARDDGVFKQGYLYVSTGLFGITRRRKWHRLYTTKLYVVEAVPGAPSCNMDIVCDVEGGTVAARPGKVPHRFTITLASGSKFNFQAENDDELIKWISALKRCASGGQSLGRPKDLRTQQAEGAAAGGGGTLSRSVRYGPAAEDLRQFLGENENSRCAECCAESVSWVSLSLGVTVCEDCACIHRQLTWAVSKLKNIQLDDFQSWQVRMLRQVLGNTVINGVWEKCVPEGWTKPTESATMEERGRWITAKYRWYGFVDDDIEARSEAELAAGMMDAVQKGDVGKIIWWTSHKAVVNCEHPVGSGNTPLHEALRRLNVNVVGFLLMNGADMYAADAQGLTPLAYVEGEMANCADAGTGDGDADERRQSIAEIFAQMLRGDF